MVKVWLLMFAAVASTVIAGPTGLQTATSSSSVGAIDALLHIAPLTRSAVEQVEYASTPPATFPHELVPRGALYVRVAIAPSTTTVVAAVPAGGPFSHMELFENVTRAGWIFTERARLFVEDSPKAPPYSLCRDSRFADIRVRALQTGDRLVRVSVHTGLQRQCSPVRGPTGELVFPTLTVPPGATASTNSRGGGEDDEHAQAFLGWSLPAEELAKSLVFQLQSFGWEPQDMPIVDGRSSLARFTIPTATGQRLSAILVLTSVGAHTVDALVRVVRQSESVPPPSRCLAAARATAPPIDTAIRPDPVFGTKVRPALPLPAYDLPSGATQSGRARQGGADWSEQRSRLFTPLPADAVCAHLVGELSAGGWTVDRTPLPGALRFKAAANGVNVAAVMVLTPLRPGAYELFWRVLDANRSSTIRHGTSQGEAAGSSKGRRD